MSFYRERKTLLGKTLPHVKNVLPQLGKAVPKLENSVPKLDGLINTLAKDRDADRSSFIVAVIGMNNGNVVTDGDYPFWSGKIKPERKTTLARIISSVYDRRHTYASHFVGSGISETSDYA